MEKVIESNIETLPLAMQFEIVDAALEQENQRHTSALQELEPMWRILKGKLDLRELHPTHRAAVRVAIAERARMASARVTDSGEKLPR